MTAKVTIAWVGIAASIGVGILYRNPALALLGTLAVRLLLDINPIVASSKISKVSLQTAIVLLGFTLGIDQLISVSADYGIIVALYVLGTLALGAAFVWWVSR